MNLTKNSNKNYLVFIVVTITVLTLFVVFSVVFKGEPKNKTSNYNKVVSLNSYSVKVSDAFYNTKTKTLSFTLRIKTNYSSSSIPKIEEIFIANSLDYSYKSVKIDEQTQLISIADVPSDFYYARFLFTSKKPDIQPEPTVDEFGDIVTHPVIKGDKESLYVYIDYRDVKFGEITPTITTTTTSTNTTTATTTLTASETPSVAVSTTTPKVTTVTSKTSQNAPQTVVTTTTKKPSTPKVTTATTTTKKPTTVTTTTPKKTTVTTAKATTTTKKPTVTTTTTKKATTTTTKKKTTTTTTTTKATTTTTVYIRLTGLALAEKGSEELLLGESITLTPVYTPSRATNKKVYWESNRPDRVIVDSNGKCTAVGVGSAIIICTSDDGGLTAAYMIIGVDG